MNSIIEIERSLLSTLLMNAGVGIEEIIDIISPEDFCIPLHASIFRSIYELYAEGSALDENTLMYKLQKHNYQQSDILEVISSMPTSDINSYANIIKDTSIRRTVTKLAGKIQKDVADLHKDTETIIDDIESEVYAISINKNIKDFKTGKVAIVDAIDHLKMIKERGNIIGVDTGFAELNDITTGFNKGELIVIGARPSMGKTALIISMISKTLYYGKGVALFNLEMSNNELMLRLFSSRCKIPMYTLRSGRLNDEEWQRLMIASDDVNLMQKFYIDDSSNLTLSSLRSKLRRLKAKDNSLSIAFIDYLQLMHTDNRNTPRHETIAEISRGLKKLAKELEIPIVALAQLNRSLEFRDDKRPILSDLKESGAIEQDADIILFIHRSEIYKARDERKKAPHANYEMPPLEMVDLIVAKNRNGQIKNIKIMFEKRFTLFYDRVEEVHVPF